MALQPVRPLPHFMIPRDPNRIDRVVELLREAWHLQPDFRLTQLVMVVTDKPEDGGAVWHTEDDTMEWKRQPYGFGRACATADSGPVEKREACLDRRLYRPT